MALISLNVLNLDNTKGSINVNPDLVETAIISPYNDKYIITISLVSGRRYQLTNSSGEHLFNSIPLAVSELNSVFGVI